MSIDNICGMLLITTYNHFKPVPQFVETEENMYLQ